MSVCDRLMHYEIFHDPHNAGNRERQIKKFRREKKIALFFEANPQWQDRSKDFVVSYKEALLQAAGRRG